MNQDLEQALLEGPSDFIKLLRALMLLHNANVVQRPEVIREIESLDAACQGLDRARRLDLVQGGDIASLKLTSVGKQICDGAKQYCNWREHSDELPHLVTEKMVRGKRVLDIGCGVGCALMTFDRYGASELAGNDLMPLFPSMARIFAAREKARMPLMVLSDGAELPFPDDHFDFIFCRLALNFMRTDKALAEMARITRRGANIIICLNTLRWELGKLATHLRKLQWKSIGFNIFTLINGIIFHAFHRQITLRYRGKMHSVHSPIFHTPWTMRRELRRWGFEPIADDAREHPQAPTFHAQKR